MEEDNKEVIVNATSVDTTNPTEEVAENEEVVGTLEDTLESDASEEEEVEESVKEKTYTEEEMKAEVEKNIKWRLARAERDNAKKLQEYEDIVNTLRAGMGKKDGNVKELNTDLKKFYKEQGIEIPETVSRGLSEREEKILAKAEAEEIINGGEDYINQIANEIYNIPVEMRTVRQKAIFEQLGKHVVQEKAKSQLKEKGIDTSILEDNSFKQFASKFTAQTSIADIYDMYQKVNAKEVVETPKRERPASTGSTKTVTKTNTVKEYYTEEEASKFTQKELMANPELLRAVENSMAQWK